MGLYKKYDDTPIFTRLDGLDTSLAAANTTITTNRSDLENKNADQDELIAFLGSANSDRIDDINALKGINRNYLRRVKSTTDAISAGLEKNIMYDYQTLKTGTDIATSDAVTFTFKKAGIYLIDTSVSFNNLVKDPVEGNGWAYINFNCSHTRPKRRLGSTNYVQSGNITLNGSIVFKAAYNDWFFISANCGLGGDIFGHSEDRTFLDITEL